MDPKSIDALRDLLGMVPSRWTLAEQVERDKVAAELRRRWRVKRKGKGLRRWVKRRPKELAKQKRKAFRARHAGEKAAQVLKIERWLAAGKMARYRPLEQVKAVRGQISRSLEAGRWYDWKEIERAAGLDPRFRETDLKWSVDAGVLEVRIVAATGPDRFGYGKARQWRWTGRHAEYEPDARRAAMYKLQELAAILNG